MTLGWEASHHFLFTNETRWCPPKLSWCPCKHSLLFHEKLPQPLDIWWSKVTLHPVWQHNIVAVPNTISRFFQAPAATIKTPSPEYLWAACWSTSHWKGTGVTSCSRGCIWTIEICVLNLFFSKREENSGRCLWTDNIHHNKRLLYIILWQTISAKDNTKNNYQTNVGTDSGAYTTIGSCSSRRSQERFFDSLLLTARAFKSHFVVSFCCQDHDSVSVFF